MCDDFMIAGAFSDGRFTRWESFPTGHLGAEPRFRELAAGTDSIDRRSGNGAWRTLLGAIAAMYAADRDRYLSYFAADAELRYAEQLDVRPVDLDESADFFIDAAAHHERSNYTLVATRGDSLCLARFDRTRDELAKTDHILVGATAGRIDVAIWFGNDQLHEALDELDRRWVDRDGTTAISELAALMGAVRRGFANLDVGAIRACLTDDYVNVDHRTLSQGERSIDAFLAATTTWVEAAGGLDFVSSDPRVDRGACFQTVRITSRGPERWEWEYIIIGLVRDGRFSRHEAFPIDAREAAEQRFAELARNTTDDPADLPAANRAWTLYRQALAAIDANDRPRLERLFGADFRCLWHEELAIRNTLDRNGWIDFTLSTNDVSKSTWHDDSLIAVRGDTLCLVRHLRNHDDYEYVRLGLIELDGDQFAEHRWFDASQLDEALAALDERHRQLQRTANTH